MFLSLILEITRDGELDQAPGHIRCCSLSHTWKRISHSGSGVAEERDLLGLLKMAVLPGFLPASGGGTHSLLLPDLLRDNCSEL